MPFYFLTFFLILLIKNVVIVFLLKRRAEYSNEPYTDLLQFACLRAEVPKISLFMRRYTF